MVFAATRDTGTVFSSLLGLSRGLLGVVFGCYPYRASPWRLSFGFFGGVPTVRSRGRCPLGASGVVYGSVGGFRVPASATGNTLGPPRKALGGVLVLKRGERREWRFRRFLAFL